jgi:hypothetical protein
MAPSKTLLERVNENVTSAGSASRQISESNLPFSQPELTMKRSGNMAMSLTDNHKAQVEGRNMRQGLTILTLVLGFRMQACCGGIAVPNSDLLQVAHC